MDLMTGSSWVLLARLVRPQGRKGEIIAEIHTDFPERFHERPKVFLAKGKTFLPTREALIEKYWLHQGRVVLKFQGVDSINDAETLRGLDVIVPVAERVPLPEDAVYIGDLIGCRLMNVADAHGTDVGEIIDVERSQGPAPDLLVVQPRKEQAGGLKKPVHQRNDEPLLIPFAKSYLVSVDIDAKRITMRLPAGLTELNTSADAEMSPAADNDREQSMQLEDEA